VDIEVVLVLDVVAAELSKARDMLATAELLSHRSGNILGLVPSDDVADADLPQASKES
jgi:hypothetical protein